MFESCLKPLLTRLDQTRSDHGNTAITALAERLMNGALNKQYNLVVESWGYTFGQNISRDFNEPASYTLDKVLGAPWADNEDNPLDNDECWNEGRRAMANGMRYDLDEDDRPLNKVKTGLKGRNYMGRFGPNQTVDIGTLTIKKRPATGEDKLCALGIFRKHNDNKPAFCGGYVEFDKSGTGKYTLSEELILQTMLDEMFEEMISGSIDLPQDYEDRLTKEYTAEIKRREAKRDGKPLPKAAAEEIHEQIKTHLKYELVKKTDPQFIERLKEELAKSQRVYQGSTSSRGATENAWVETYFSWVMFDENTWNYIKGKNPPFNYDFIGGDDASGVGQHELTPDTIEDAFSIHGCLFIYAAAAYLLDAQDKNKIIPPSIIKQLTEVADHLDSLPKVDPEYIMADYSQRAIQADHSLPPHIISEPQDRDGGHSPGGPQ